jgi:hypothetical protein
MRPRPLAPVLVAIALGAVATVVALASSGEPAGQRPPARAAPSLEAAQDGLRAELDRVASGPLGHLRWRAEPAAAAVLCDGPDGAPSAAARSASAGLEAPLPDRVQPAAAIAAVAAAWRARGLTAVARDEGDPLAPAVSARRERMLLELVVNARSRRAFLGGSTPCLPRRARRTAG